MPKIQTVEISSTDGWRLPGELRLPDSSGANGANGARVLLLHQLRRDKHTMDALSDALVSRGFVTLAVDARGHGKSLKDGHARSWELFDEPKGEFKGLVDDAQAAYDFLRHAPALVKKGPVFVLGSSVGGNCAVILASKSENSVAGVVLLSAGLNYRGVDCREELARVKCPALIAASQEDSYAHHCSQKMAALISESVFVDLMDAGHGTDMLRYDNLFGRVVEWLVSHSEQA